MCTRILFLALLLPIYFFRLAHIVQYQIPLDRPVKIQGRISEQPYLKGSYQIINMGPILAITDRFPGYSYGDKVQVVGKFEREVINPFQPQYLTSFPTIQKIEANQNLTAERAISRFFLKARGLIESKVTSLLPEPEGSLLLGVVFGVKTQMPESFLQNLRKTGTIHLVVASGQNVAILAGFLIETGVWLMKRKRAIVLTLIAIFSYVLMTGGQAPVVRAAMMISLAYLAQLFGREGEGMWLLMIAGALMLLISPLILFDISFQLSFGATAGIILIYPRMQPKFSRLPVLGAGLATTLSAQLATLPILLTNFGQLSWLAPAVNALVLPTIPLIMSLGGVLAMASLVVNPLAQVLTWLIWPVLKYFVILVNYFGAVPWAAWEIGQLGLVWAVGYYLVLGVMLSKK